MEDRSLSTREVGIFAIIFGPSNSPKGDSSHSFDASKIFEAAFGDGCRHAFERFFALCLIRQVTIGDHPRNAGVLQPLGKDVALLEEGGCGQVAAVDEEAIAALAIASGRPGPWSALCPRFD